MIRVDAQVVGSFSKALEKKLAEIRAMPEPDFARYVPNFEKMHACAARYAHVEHFVFVGQGGAVSSLHALFTALGAFKTTKQVFFVSTTDPDYIAFVRAKCPVATSLVVGISSSGVNVNQIEAFFAFQDYPRLVIARRLPSALMEIAAREKLEVVESPDLSDRFAGHSELALIPAALLYIPADRIFAGAQGMFAKCRPSVAFEANPALKIATLLFLLEKEGFTEVLVPIYAVQLGGFAEVITQLMHETVGKRGKGQTFLVMPAPELQHHTSQRFFDGRKNMAGVFVRVEQFEHQDMRVRIPQNVQDVFIRDDYLRVVDGLALQKTLECEYQGMKGRADELKIPNMTLTLERLTPESAGAFLALWQYVAVYSALLRDLDPFTQPAVEASKELSFGLRKAAQGNVVSERYKTGVL